MDTLTRNELIDRKLFKQFAEVNNWRAASDVLMRLTLHVVCVSLSYYFLSNGNVVLGILVAIPHFVAFSFLGWAGIGHELFHGTVFSNRKVNVFLFRLFSVLTWSNYGYFEVTHWKHHKDTLLPDDPEGDPSLGLKSSSFFWLFTFDIPGFVRRLKILILNAIDIVPGPLGGTFFKKASQQRASLVASARIILSFHATMVVCFVATEATYLIVLFTIAPFVLTFFNRLFAVSQHYGTQSVATSDYLLTTRTVVLDKVSSFLYANMNYHIEHHYFPSIPYYNLPKLHQHLRTTVTYRYYARGFRQMFLELKKLGCFRG